jgi:capsular exopolysaccharide synthesis family protein
MVLEDAPPPLQETGVENLQLLAAGTRPPNPADLLGSSKIDALLAQLLEEAEIVLLDAPPVVAVTDAAVLGAKADGVLLVVSAGKTRREQAERAKALLEKAHVRIVGAALTNAPKEDGSG